MINGEALKTSLDSLLESGSKDLDIDNVREYYMLYTNTLEYIKSNREPNGEINTYYDKFPKLKYYNIDNSQNVVMGYVEGFFKAVTTGSAMFSNPDENNPAKRALFHEIRENLPVINRVASELLLRLGVD